LVCQFQMALYAALRRVVEYHCAAAHLDVFATQRGQSARVVLLGVLLAAGAEIPEVDQMQGHREHALAVQSAAAEVGCDPISPLGQRRGELEHAVELLLGAFLLPHGVIEVLAASRGVGAHRLDMSVAVGADPDFSATPVVSPVRESVAASLRR